MNTANNIRRQKSRERIEKVFVELLQTRELHEITVSDICKLAPVNRTTFYAIYDDIYALADSIRKDLEQNVLTMYQQEYADGYNSNDYLRLFRHIAENKLPYRTYFKLGYADTYKILRYDREQAERYFQNQFIEYHMEFFRSGLNRMIKMWLDCDCAETPEEMFSIIKAEYRGRPESFGVTVSY